MKGTLARLSIRPWNRNKKVRRAVIVQLPTYSPPGFFQKIAATPKRTIWCRATCNVCTVYEYFTWLSSIIIGSTTILGKPHIHSFHSWSMFQPAQWFTIQLWRWRISQVLKDMMSWRDEIWRLWRWLVAPQAAKHRNHYFNLLHCIHLDGDIAQLGIQISVGMFHHDLPAFTWWVLNQFSPLKARGSSLVTCSKEKEPLKSQMQLQKLTYQLMVNWWTAARWFGFRLDPQFTITWT